MSITIRVAGVPKPKGSMRGFFHKKLGRNMMTNANPKTKAWERLVADAARAEMICSARTLAPQAMLSGALLVEVRFYLPRPKGHLGKGKNEGRLLPSSPKRPDVKPDIDKLTRSTLDALMTICFHDDSSVVELLASKHYADGREPGADLYITCLEVPDVAVSQG